MVGGGCCVKKSERLRCRLWPLWCSATRSKCNRGSFEPPNNSCYWFVRAVIWWSQFVGFRVHDSIIDILETVLGIDKPRKGLQHQISNRNQKPFTDELDNKDGLSLGHCLNDTEMIYRFSPLFLPNRWCPNRAKEALRMNYLFQKSITS